MASGPISSWQIEGGKVEAVTDFILFYFILFYFILFLWAPKSLCMVTAAMKLKDACSLEENNLGSILKSRDITWLKKVCIVKAMIFPVGMYTCESWTIKKAE